MVKLLLHFDVSNYTHVQCMVHHSAHCIQMTQSNDEVKLVGIENYSMELFGWQNTFIWSSHWKSRSNLKSDDNIRWITQLVTYQNLIMMIQWMQWMLQVSVSRANYYLNIYIHLMFLYFILDGNENASACFKRTRNHLCLEM